MRLFISSFVASFALAASVFGLQNPTRPDAYLGHALAADFTLPNWDQVRGYFEQLDRESKCVELRTIGKTTEGRDFVVALISSADNLARVDELRRYSALFTDPRGASDAQRAEALEKGRVFLFISCAMHATECAAPQFAMQLAYDLATSDAEPFALARQNCVVILAPSLNPDGLDHVVEWYRKTVNTPFETSDLPELYQHYCGHDNNRDWFMLTQKETRLVTEQLYSVWKPQVYWDVHQQGTKAERMFVPPFRDPLDPNLDPGVVCGMNLLGTRAQADMTREKKSGVASGVTFDMWWNGGNRNVPVRHNIVGLLTEAASCRLASPMFVARDELRFPSTAKDYAATNSFPDPWPGGWWHLSDIVGYELGFARSLLGSLSRERRFWLENQMEAAQRTIDGAVPGAPQAWVVPSSNADRGATRRLCDVLLATGVELHAARDAFEAEGRSWPAGSIVISAHQPYARHVKDLFDTQSYPQGDAPYDVAGWTLPALLGVDAAELRQPFQAALEPVKTLDEVQRALSRSPRPGGIDTASLELTMRDSDEWKDVFARVTRGEMPRAFQAGASSSSDKAKADPKALDKKPPVENKRDEKKRDETKHDARSSAAPAVRIALYSPWTGNVDEGWTRWVFDQFGVPYVVVRNEALRVGHLRDAYDVLLLPGVNTNELDRGRAEGSVFDELSGGLDPEGAIAVEEFVRGGGTLIAAGNSCAWAIELFKLPLVDVTTDAKDFNCPGSVLRTIPEHDPITAGLAESVAVFGASPRAFREATEKERETAKSAPGHPDVLLRYAPTRTLISGYLAKPEVIAGQAAWVRAVHGEGRVHLFGFRPQYRGWSQAAFQLLFRALLFDAPAR